MQAETINITALAKLNKGTTPATRAKLEKLGINPVQEVVMESGRKFVLFEKVKAIKALEKSRADRERKVEQKAKQAEKKQQKPLNSAPAKPAPQPTEDMKAMLAELRELKSINAQLLEAFTKPTNPQP